MRQLQLGLALIAGVALTFGACAPKGGGSTVTGWSYNNTKNGGFQVVNYQGQATAPNLVLIQGGTFVHGQAEADLMYEYHSMPRRITVSSFYMDETEVANVHYREYIYWVRRVFAETYPEVLKAAMPDTLVWRDELGYNEPYVENYFRHPAFNFYPVVGVSWLQATEFCKWRTDRVNEDYLVRNRFQEMRTDQTDDDNFNTDAYLLGQYEGTPGKNKMKDLDPNGSGERQIRKEDGILIPDYRLPTEAEWEYAALALIGNHVDPDPTKGQEIITNQRLYPWNSPSMRESRHGGWQGRFLANFKRGRGDYAGLAGNLNDNAVVTADIWSFMPNDYGLFNMAGNVNEWVMDVYRQFTWMDANDLNTFRGNDFEQLVLDEKGQPIDKDSLGRMQYEIQPDEAIRHRRNYQTGNARDYLDGDTSSNIVYNSPAEPDPSFNSTTLVSNRTRVYKGGSWADEAYFLQPGTRRYLEEDQSLNTLGFRCAMIRLGGDTGNERRSGNIFGENAEVRKQNQKRRMGK